jgi:DNA-damage-inducible protein D
MKTRQNKALVIFQGKQIRRTWHKDEWWFSVVDVVGVLTESSDSRNYWKVLKHRLIAEGGNETVTNCNQLKLPAEDGKLRLTDCTNTETMLRIVQSIPSKKAEPFKRWLAEVGYERIQDKVTPLRFVRWFVQKQTIENPELAQDRAKKYYELKGYPKDCVNNMDMLRNPNNLYFKRLELDAYMVCVYG